MSTSKGLADLLSGRTGGDILTLLYRHADQPFYIRQIAREVREIATRKTLITRVSEIWMPVLRFHPTREWRYTTIRYVPHDKMRRHASAEFQMW